MAVWGLFVLNCQNLMCWFFGVFSTNCLPTINDHRSWVHVVSPFISLPQLARVVHFILFMNMSLPFVWCDVMLINSNPNKYSIDTLMTVSVDSTISLLNINPYQRKAVQSPTKILATAFYFELCKKRCKTKIVFDSYTHQLHQSRASSATYI